MLNFVTYVCTFAIKYINKNIFLHAYIIIINYCNNDVTPNYYVLVYIDYILLCLCGHQNLSTWQYTIWYYYFNEKNNCTDSIVSQYQLLQKYTECRKQTNNLPTACYAVLTCRQKESTLNGFEPEPIRNSLRGLHNL